MTGLAHAIDPFRAWARAVVDGAFDGPWERQYAVGCAYLRGLGRGRVVGVTGVHEIHEAIGDLVMEAKLPTLGAPKSDHYEGDGYVIVRHPETAVVEAALTRIIETVQVHYG
jgi:coproporphyrinogen III oxidase